MELVVVLLASTQVTRAKCMTCLRSQRLNSRGGSRISEKGGGGGGLLMNND